MRPKSVCSICSFYRRKQHNFTEKFIFTWYTISKKNSGKPSQIDFIITQQFRKLCSKSSETQRMKIKVSFPWKLSSQPRDDSNGFEILENQRETSWPSTITWNFRRFFWLWSPPRTNMYILTIFILYLFCYIISSDDFRPSTTKPTTGYRLI